MPFVGEFMAQSIALYRQWNMLRSMSRSETGLTIADLARENEVGIRTIRRDMLTLVRVGFPLQETVGRFGRKLWRVAPQAGVPPLSFAFDEALALYFGRRLLDPLAGTLFWDAAQRAFRKIRAGLNPSALRYIDRMGTAFHHTAIGNSDYEGKGDLLDRLLVAVEDCKVTLLTYHSERSTEPVTREIHPYGWTYHSGSLYLTAFATAVGELRTYKLDRITDVDVDPNMKFPRPQKFDLASHFAGSFGVYRATTDKPVKVRVRFTKDAARFVSEKQWHASQQFTRQADGGLVAEFELTNLTEFQSWILSFGPNAEVLEPAELRRAMADVAEKTLARYASAPVSRKPSGSSLHPRRKPK